MSQTNRVNKKWSQSQVKGRNWWTIPQLIYPKNRLKTSRIRTNSRKGHQEIDRTITYNRKGHQEIDRTITYSRKGHQEIDRTMVMRNRFLIHQLKIMLYILMIISLIFPRIYIQTWVHITPIQHWKYQHLCQYYIENIQCYAARLSNLEYILIGKSRFFSWRDNMLISSCAHSKNRIYDCSRLLAFQQ